MFPFAKHFKLLVWMFFYDANAFRRWMRALVATLAVNGAVWGDQLEVFAPHKVVLVFKGICWVLAIFVAAHGDAIVVPSQDADPTLSSK